MPTILKTKNSVTTTVVPTTLQQGELAVNITDKKMWVGNAATTPVQLFGAGADGSFVNLAYTGTLTGGTGIVNLGSGQFYKDASGRILIGSTSSVGNSNANNLEITNPAGSGVCGLTFNVNSGSANTGNIYWRSNASNNAIQIVGDPISNYFAVATAGAERMRIASNGNFAIGTDNASRKLVVNNGGSDAYILTTTTATSGAGTAGIMFQTGSSNYDYSNMIRVEGGVNAMQFWTADSERMRITSAGRVAIGTTETGAEFNVYGSNANPVSSTTFWTPNHEGIILRNTSDVTNTVTGISFQGGSSGAGISGIGNILENTTLGALGFFTGGSGRSNTVPERMRIDSSGNVGIGMTSPTITLDVFGSGMRVKDGSQTVLLTQNYSGGLGALGSETNNPFAFITNGTERMRIDSSGRILAGTTATFGGANSVFNAAADCAGAQCFAANNTNTGATSQYVIPVYRNGTLTGGITNTNTATGFATSSDYRLKENIAPMTGALAKVQSLKPCTYTWKADGSASEGFIAHELQEVVPNAVIGEKDGEQMQGIDTSFLVATLTAAIQEQQALIENLTTRLNALEGK